MKNLTRGPGFNPQTDYIHVAFVGAQGTGKTTLTEEIVKKYDYPYRDEGARELLKKYNLTGEDHALGAGEFWHTTLALQKDIQRHYLRTWSMPRAFVDRCQVDALAYVTFWLSRVNDPKAIEFVEEQKAITADDRGLYDGIILVPPNIPLVADGVRSPRVAYRDHIHWLIVGILDELDFDYYTLQSSGREERIEEVSHILDEVARK